MRRCRSPFPLGSRIATALVCVAACGRDQEATEHGGGGSVTSHGAASSEADGGSELPQGSGTSSGAETETATGSTGGTGDTTEEPQACRGLDAWVTDDASVPDKYGFATLPPRMALSDTFYVYGVRTGIGSCATGRVEWSLDDAPAGAALEVGEQKVAVGETLTLSGAGATREAAKLAWSLEGVEPGCYSMQVRWRAWRDCGALDSGKWGPEVVQRWDVHVRDNHWVSGDLHVHTRYSERGDQSGSAYDYYRRMINAEPDDAGGTFESRRFSSPRGRLHWLVFSDHTNNNHEECGSHFPTWCAGDQPFEHATGRDVVRALTEQDPSVLLVLGSEISNKFNGHFGFIPLNPYPGHPIYAPGYTDNATDYDRDFGFGPGVFRERWVDESTTNTDEIRAIQEMNALAIVNHEDGTAFWIQYDWSSTEFDGLEVWNGGNRHSGDDDSAYNGKLDLGGIVDNGLSTNIPEGELQRSWVGLLKQGRWPLALVGGSDVHDYKEVSCGGATCDPLNSELGRPMTTVWAPSFVWANGIDGVVDGIKAGRAVVHDRSNFIDLRAVHGNHEYLVGDTLSGYAPGTPIDLRAFGRVAKFIDGDNRVLLVLGTSGDPTNRRIDVLYNSKDAMHFIEPVGGRLEQTYIRPDTNFDRQREIILDEDKLSGASSYFIWAQFVPWHNPLYLNGNGSDMVVTGAIRVTTD